MERDKNIKLDFWNKVKENMQSVPLQIKGMYTSSSKIISIKHEKLRRGRRNDVTN